MNSYCKTVLMVVAVTLTLMLCIPAVAQGPADLTVADPAAPDATPAATPADPLPASPVPQYGSPFSTGDGWRGTISIYGWFPGVHGTVGALGHNAGFSSPFSDVFHGLKGIIPIAVEANKGRFVMPIDYFWVKLADGKATPFTDTTGQFFNVHLTESIFTPWSDTVCWTGSTSRSMPSAVSAIGMSDRKPPVDRDAGAGPGFCPVAELG